MRYHFTPIRMSIFNKSKNKCWGGCGEKGTHTLLVGLEIGTAIMENNLEVSQKIKNGYAFQPSNCTSVYLSKENQNNNQ
mgnify:CR=1 FL=1